jgi:hypothetical protein
MKQSTPLSAIGFFVLWIGTAFGQSPTPTPLTLSVPTDRAWVVGITSLKGTNLDTENRYITYSLPMRIKESLETIKTHSIKYEQMQDYKKEVRDVELQKLKDQLAKLQAERDEIVFSTRDPAEAEKAVKTFDEQKGIAKIQEAVTALINYDFADIKVPEKMPVVFKTQEPGGTLLKPADFSVLQYAKREKIDLVVYGTVEEVQGFLFLDISAYESAIEQEVYHYQTTTTAEEVYILIKDIADRLATVVLGNEWARLTLVPDPPDSRIYLDGEFISAGKITLSYTDPGSHTLEVRHPDCTVHKSMVELAPFEEKEVSVTLERNEPVRIRITSEPEGATLYVNSVYSGKTPLEIDGSTEKRRATLKLDGYEEHVFTLDESTGSELAFTLQVKIEDRKARQNAVRDNFYFAFGFFLASIPVPVACNRFSQDYRQAALLAQSVNPSQSAGFFTTSTIFNYAFYGGVAVSVGLFIYTMFTLYDYITTADRPLG